MVIGTATGNASIHGTKRQFVAATLSATGAENLTRRELQRVSVPKKSPSRGASASGGWTVTVYNPNTILGIYNRKLGTILGSDFGSGI